MGAYESRVKDSTGIPSSVSAAPAPSAQVFVSQELIQQLIKEQRVKQEEPNPSDQGTTSRTRIPKPFQLPLEPESVERQRHARYAQMKNYLAHKVVERKQAVIKEDKAIDQAIQLLDHMDLAAESAATKSNSDTCGDPALKVKEMLDAGMFSDGFNLLSQYEACVKNSSL